MIFLLLNKYSVKWQKQKKEGIIPPFNFIVEKS